MILNKEQKEAVEHKEGAMLVIAGAGTGKTRVLTERVVSLVQSGAAKSEEVLALTFTEKAASEMVERIDLAMPLGYEELCVKTFHAFSEMILREAGLEIGLDPGYKVLDQAEQWFLFKKNLYDFNLDYYRPLGNPNKFVYSILNHFGKLKDELIRPDDYLAYAENLEEGEDKEKMLEIARVYKEWQELLLSKNFLTFGDLTYFVIELFKTRKSVLKEYASRFKYILVDEFQDTNYAQYFLVKMLSGEHGNLFVVGDDDQSIYKWRGASLSNILQFEEDFPDAKKTVLVENYRSVKSVLDCSYELVRNNDPDRLEVRSDINKKLNCNVEGEQRVSVEEFGNFLQESEFVAKKILELHQSGVPYEECAILVRANQLSIPFIDELRALGVPFQVRDPKGLFSLEEIKDLIAVLKFIANPYDDVAFMRILRLEVFEVAMAEILKLIKDANKDHLFKYLQESEEGEDNLTIPGLESGLEKVKALMKELIEFSKNNSVGIVLNSFVEKSGYLDRMVKSEKFEEIYNINELAKQIAKFERENDDKTVLDFVSYLNLLEESSLPLPRDGGDERNSVQILTTHGSKGLEFDYVFVVSCVKGRFPTNRRRETFEVPEELTKEIYPEGDHHIQEERRLFYVAMTRAKKGLYLTYSKKYSGNKEWRPSPFVKEVLKSDLAELRVHDASEDAVKKLMDFKEPAKPMFELPEMTSKRLSYSQLSTFEICPLKYNYRYIMKVPVPPSHAANFGTSVHNALNEFYRLMKNGKSVDIELMRSLYEKYWIGYGYDSKAHERERFKKGWEMLEEFFKCNSQPSWTVPAFLERPFMLKLGDYAFSGRIDRIDKLNDGTYEVIDYKTGRLKPRLNLDNDMQLSMYALACRDVYGLKVSKLSLYFLEDNQKVSTTRGEDQLALFKHDIQAAVKEMQSSEFMPTPGYMCNFCDYRLICPAV